MNMDTKNCEQARMFILLESSGELSKGDSRSLSAHMSGCRNCRKFKAHLDLISKTAPDALSAGEPSPAVVEGIARKASDQHITTVLHFPVLQVRWLAAAAAVLLLCGGIWLTTPSYSGRNHVQEMNTLILAMRNINPDTAITENAVESVQLKELGEQLLKLEGLDWNEQDMESLILNAEPLPTSSRWNSIPAFPAGTSV